MTPRTIAISALITAGLIVPIAWGTDGETAAAAPAPKPASLESMDYIEIQQLVARYGYALDSGAPEGTGNEYADLYTGDGIFIGPGVPADSRGHEKLAALAKVSADGTSRRGPNYVSHFLMNHLIEPTSDGAIGKVYLLAINFGANGAPSSVRMGGHYDDVYAKTKAGWRFKKREFFRGRAETPAEAWAPLPIRGPAADAGAVLHKGSRLTPMDYIEIRKLVANYAYGLDTGADNGYMYADLFAPGAVVFGTTTGRENIANLARREPHGPEYVRHFLTNVVIEPSGEGAVGRQYLVVIDVGEGGKPSSIFLGGRYEDVYVKTSQGWRFKSRTLVPAKG